MAFARKNSKQNSTKPSPRREIRMSRSPNDRVNTRQEFRKLGCFFCLDKSNPHYLYSSLNRYITEKGKIIPQTHTGLCQKHQRLVTQEIKKARYLALMPFTTTIR